MNLKNISKTLFVLPFTLLIGCADFLDVNDSPNNPLDVPLNTLLASGLVAAGFANANELNRFGSTVSDYTYGAGNAPSAYDVYAITGGDFGNQWTNEIWNGGLIQFQQIIEKGEEKGATNYVGVAKIMQAYMWAMTTDIWGDIPYSQALQGTDGITRPEVDSQEFIYKGSAGKPGLFDLCREGIASLAVASPIVMGTDDVVFGGVLANWRRAGYTLMIRMAMTISAKEPALAKSIIEEVIAANEMISTNAQNLSVKFGATVGSQSPIYSYMFVTTFLNDMTVSTRYLTLLQGLADPRLTLYVTIPNATRGYVTFDNGFRGNLGAPADFSKWGTAVTGANGAGPVRLVTNAGRAFMLAEAMLTLGVVYAGQTPQSLYYEGMRAALTEAGVAAATINTYIGATAATATPVATLSGTTANMQNQIITQKYIAMTGNGLEAWNDIRRTGLPLHTQAEHQNAAGEDGKRPVRARYPDADIARNPNLGTALQKTNVKVWWDAN